MRNPIVIALFACLLLIHLPSASACSRFEVTPIENMVEFSDLVISASVDYADEFGQNIILKVDRYFKGSGGKYLPVVFYRPAVYYADAVRDYDNGCLDLGHWSRRFQKDQYGYFALHANGDGTYDYYYESVWIPEDLSENGKLESTAGLVEFFLHWQSEIELKSPAPVDEFEDLLLQLSGAGNTTQPQAGNYPLMRFLNITTESGKRYRLNPDYTVTLLDPDKWPIAISNDGSHLMFRLEMDELGFQYLALVKKEHHPCPFCQPLGSAAFAGGTALSVGAYSHNGWLAPVNGWHGTFSPDSNFVAVQERNELLIYMFDNWSSPGEGEQHGQSMSMKVVAGQRVSWDPFFGAEPLVWSADSTTISFQDYRGVWHWDLFEEMHPQLILPDADGETLLDISSSGRYIRYSQENSWSLLDVESGETFKNAIATPDERNVIYVRSSYPKGTVTAKPGRENDSRKHWRQCLAPLSKCPIHIISKYRPVEFFEYQPGWIGLVSRAQIQMFPWHLSMEEGMLRVAADPPERIAAFDYDSNYNRPAIAYGEYTIGLSFSWNYGFAKNMKVEDDYSPIFLREHLDSPIAEVEWGQPVFLDRR